MLTQQNIIDFCNQYDYDIRKSHNGRWIDQKCAADVVTMIADCIYNYNAEHQGEFFTSKDIWNYKYAVENIEIVFKKPNVQSPMAKNEYDKFFQQPMEMLANAKVLTKEKRGNKNFYKVGNPDILEYIALRERNALTFLKIYIEKVLKDSDIFYLFEDFFNAQTKSNYETLKDGYSQFIINHTKINKELECNRIFIKVLNPLAYYQSRKAKRFLKLFNDQYRNSQSEYVDGIHNDKATQMHHIFPESEYPEICYFLENIIALTPTQHLNYAHPDNRTQEINQQYQHLLLLAKAERIKENLNGLCGQKIYEFAKFLFVLNVGFDNDDVLTINDMDFCSVVNIINIYYRNI